MEDFPCQIMPSDEWQCLVLNLFLWLIRVNYLGITGLGSYLCISVVAISGTEFMADRTKQNQYLYHLQFTVLKREQGCTGINRGAALRKLAGMSLQARIIDLSQIVIYRVLYNKQKVNHFTITTGQILLLQNWMRVVSKHSLNNDTTASWHHTVDIL